MGVEPKLDN